MFYSIYKANLLRKQWEDNHKFKYDLVIRTRSDMEFSNGIPMNELTDSLLDDNLLHLVIDHGVWDQFAF